MICEIEIDKKPYTVNTEEKTIISKNNPLDVFPYTDESFDFLCKVFHVYIVMREREDRENSEEVHITSTS